MNTKVLQKNIPKGWQIKQFEDCVILPAKLKGLKSSEYKPFGKYPIFDQAKEYISGYTNEESILNTNYPAILFGDHTRVLKYIESPFILGADGTKVFWSKEDIDSSFLYYSLLNLNVPNTGYNRHFKFLKDSEILLPEKTEQKKIAEILWSVDEEIQKVEEIISATEKLKQGLMKRLFTKGREFKLNDLCVKIIGGGTPARNIEEYWNGDIPWVTVKDLTNKKFISDAQEKITRTGLENSASNIIPKGNIITSTRMGIGRFYINDMDVAINQDLKGLILKDNVIVDFLYYFLLSRASILETKGVGSTVKGIKVEELKNLPVLIPNVEEQKRISATFSLVDEKNSINKKVKESLILLKKGLMNDLLTGKVRTI